MVKWLRYKHHIPLCPTHMKGELTVKQVAQRYGISRHMVYYWIETQVIQAQKSHCGTYRISISDAKDQELIAWTQFSREEKIKRTMLSRK